MKIYDFLPKRCTILKMKTIFVPFEYSKKNIRGDYRLFWETTDCNEKVEIFFRILKIISKESEQT